MRIKDDYEQMKALYDFKIDIRNKRRILVPIKAELKIVLPFKDIPSYLITLVILQYIGLLEALDFLQIVNHSSRSYARNNIDMLTKRISLNSFCS